jgi:hypothetical protein
VRFLILIAALMSYHVLFYNQSNPFSIIKSQIRVIISANATKFRRRLKHFPDFAGKCIGRELPALGLNRPFYLKGSSQKI